MKPLSLILIALLTSTSLLNAQHNRLAVGSQAPQITVLSWIKGEPITRFNPGRIYVLEFGATWCVPCAKAIPELTKLATEFKTHVTVASLFVMERNEQPSSPQEPGYVSRVKRFVEKRATSIAYSVGIDTPDKSLVNSWLTPLGYNRIPVVCVINQHGQIAWTGTSVSTAIPTIKSLITNGSIKSQADVEPQPAQVPTTQQQKDSTLFYSALTRYQKKGSTPNSPYISGYHWVRGNPELESVLDNVQAIGRPIDQLYYLAYADTLSNMVPFRNFKNEFPDTLLTPYHNSSYGKYWFRTLLEVADRTPFEFNKKLTRNRYNYALRVPRGAGSAALMQLAMRNDLNTYFGYKASVEIRRMPCWNLIIADKQKVNTILHSKDPSAPFQTKNDEQYFTFRNASMRDLITMLGSTFGYGTLDYGRLPLEDQAPFIDMTGIANAVDFTFDRRLTFAETKQALEAIGLDLVKSEKPMKVVVLRD